MIDAPRSSSIMKSHCHFSCAMDRVQIYHYVAQHIQKKKKSNYTRDLCGSLSHETLWIFVCWFLITNIGFLRPTAFFTIIFLEILLWNDDLSRLSLAACSVRAFTTREKRICDYTVETFSTSCSNAIGVHSVAHRVIHETLNIV